MARKRKKKSLYEVIRGSRSKLSYDGTLEKMHPVGQQSSFEGAERADKWPRRPQIVQFNAGRIEISMPYPLGIALALGVILLVLVIFRLGQMTDKESFDTVVSVENAMQSVEARSSEMTIAELERQKPVIKATPASATEGESGADGSAASNRIVIQTYGSKVDLEPAKYYFSVNGIETEIKKIGDTYYLVTARKYQNPQRPGTDGYRVREKIIALGAEYKAPAGYETFGKKPFHDAYGMKFDD